MPGKLCWSRLPLKQWRTFFFVIRLWYVWTTDNEKHIFPGAIPPCFVDLFLRRSVVARFSCCCVSCGSWASMLLRKWREMEKAVGKGESSSRTRAANGNIWRQGVKNHIWKYFFDYLRLLYWLVNLFYSSKRWELRSSISHDPFFKYPVYV